MLVATEAEIRAAFAKAGWSNSVRLTTESKLETARALIEDRGYKEGPRSAGTRRGHRHAPHHARAG
jgi:hypothetical protein